MIHSMTGFGAARRSLEGREVAIEIKSVNHRFLDVVFRMPRALQFLEEPLRALLSQHLERGHVELFLTYQNSREDARQVEIDHGLVHAYCRAAQALSAELGLPNDLTVSKALRLPEVVRIAEGEEDRQVLTDLACDGLADALSQLCAMRQAEGERLKADLSQRLCVMKDLVDAIAARAPMVPLEYKARLEGRIAELLLPAEIDQARLANEVAFFADKVGIDEEITRLRSHFGQFGAMLAESTPVGRKLDFLVQEMNRECNTIGSKAQDENLAALVVSAKAELEKMKEQVQNIQ